MPISAAAPEVPPYITSAGFIPPCIGHAESSVGYVEAVLVTPLLLITENICAPSLEESTCNVLNLPSWIYEAPISNH